MSVRRLGLLAAVLTLGVVWPGSASAASQLWGDYAVKRTSYELTSPPAEGDDPPTKNRDVPSSRAEDWRFCSSGRGCRTRVVSLDGDEYRTPAVGRLTRSGRTFSGRGTSSYFGGCYRSSDIKVTVAVTPSRARRIGSRSVYTRFTAVLTLEWPPSDPYYGYKGGKVVARYAGRWTGKPADPPTAGLVSEWEGPCRSV